MDGLATTCLFVLNTCNAAGVSRRHDQNVTDIVINVKIEIKKCIQKSPNMPSIGSLFREIDIKIVRNLIKANKLLLSTTNAHVISVNL